MNNIWSESEGDNWFLRNKEALNKINIENDIIVTLLNLYKLKPNKIIEIGAANGYRVNYLNNIFQCIDAVAVEPSLKAVTEGKDKYPKIRFINSTCEDIGLSEKFDLVIINFVFHWIYRENLFTNLKIIDQLIKDNGHLIIGDFGTDNFIKRDYGHLKEGEFFTWKMPYWKLFSDTGNYVEIANLRFDHDNKTLTTDINNNNMGTLVLLKKMSNYLNY